MVLNGDEKMKDCIKKIRELERGKIYWLQIKKGFTREEMENITGMIREIGEKENFEIIITFEGIDFIDAPPGYEVKKKEK